ncbi:MAG: GNAT family N-acetyltransferase [Propionicimonas sp.]
MPSTEWIASDRSSDCQPSEAPIQVVRKAGGEVVGTANMYANRSGPGSHIASASYMLDAAHRGRGIGRALVVDSLRWARGCGFQGMQFNAVAETNVNAVRLYESLGFTVLGTVPGGFRHPLDGDVGLHIMFCLLENEFVDEINLIVCPVIGRHTPR